MELAIIIPSAGKPLALERCLRSLFQHCHRPLEIWVIGDGGISAPREKSLRHTFPSVQFHCYERSRGPAFARNLGAVLSRGKYLVFLDDDTRITAQWWTSVQAHLKDPRTLLVAGRMECGEKRNIFSLASQDLVNAFSLVHKGQKETTFMNSGNCIVRRDIFEQLKGFRHSFSLAAGEDRDFSDRAVHQGIPIHFDEKLLALHYPELGLSSFIKQNFRYGRGSAMLHRSRTIKAPSSLKTVRTILSKSLRKTFTHPLHFPLTLLAQASTFAGRMVENFFLSTSQAKG